MNDKREIIDMQSTKNKMANQKQIDRIKKESKPGFFVHKLPKIQSLKTYESHNDNSKKPKHARYPSRWYVNPSEWTKKNNIPGTMIQELHKNTSDGNLDFKQLHNYDKITKDNMDDETKLKYNRKKRAYNKLMDCWEKPHINEAFTAYLNNCLENGDNIEDLKSKIPHFLKANVNFFEKHEKNSNVYRSTNRSVNNTGASHFVSKTDFKDDILQLNENKQKNGNLNTTKKSNIKKDINPVINIPIISKPISGKRASTECLQMSTSQILSPVNNFQIEQNTKERKFIPESEKVVRKEKDHYLEFLKNKVNIHNINSINLLTKFQENVENL